METRDEAPSLDWFVTRLPQPLAHRIVTFLPVEDKFRWTAVCRAWRDAFTEPMLWSRLDFTGIACYRRITDILRSVAARAHGQLLYLDVSEPRLWRHLSKHALLEVVAANAASLRVLAVGELPHSPVVADGRTPFGVEPLVHARRCWRRCKPA